MRQAPDRSGMVPLHTIPQTLASTDTPKVTPPTEPKEWPEWDDAALAKCKVAAGDLPIYKVENLDKIFVVRPIRSAEWNETLKEFADGGEISTMVVQDEVIAHKFVLWPELSREFWSETLAGHPSTVATEIRKDSGFPIVLDDGTIIGKKIDVTPLTKPVLLEAPDPTDEVLQELAKRVPNGALYGATYPADGYKFVFGAMPRAMWKSIQNRQEKSQDVDTPMETVISAVVWGNIELGNLPAGYIDGLAAQVMRVSGFNLEPTVTQL